MSSPPATARLLPALGARERCAVWLILGVFLLVGANNVIHHAFAGQDYSLHLGGVTHLLAHPDQWVYHDFTNRPLIYWIALDAMSLTDDRATNELTAVFFVLINACALGLFYDCLRRFILSPVIRVAALALIATLPVTLTTSVVFAADAVVQPPFVLLGWSLIRWTEDPSPRAGRIFSALAGVALLIGNVAKFTFLGVPLVVLLLALLLWRWRRVSLRHTVWMLSLAVVVPLSAGLWLHHHAKQQFEHQSGWHAFDWRGTGEMTWRDLLLPRTSDTGIFYAPKYWDHHEENGRTAWPVIEDHSYSYPALLHLSTYTDVLNFGDGGFRRGHLPRPPVQQTCAQLSVITGLVFSFTALAAVAVLGWRILRAIVQPALSPETAPTIWLTLALAWHLAIALPLPFVHHAYGWGYWLPRLILPSLWAYFAVLYAFLDHRFAGHRNATGLIVGVTALQVGLQLRSVWFA